MDELKKLFDLIKKEVVTIKEFQYITNHEFVTSVTFVEGNKRHRDCSQYIVRYENADSDVIYVKRS